MSSQERLEEIETDIEEARSDSPTAENIPAHFIPGSSKLETFIKSPSPIPTKLRRGIYETKIAKPFLVRNVRITTSASPKDFLTKYQLIIIDLLGEEHEIPPNTTKSGEEVLYIINKVCSTIRIKSKGSASLKKRPELDKIKVIGYRETDFEEIANYASKLFDLKQSISSELNSAKNDVAKLEEQYANLELKTENISNEISNLESDKIQKEQELEEVTKNLQETKNILQDTSIKSDKLTKENNNLQISIDDKKGERSDLAKQVNELKSEQRRLTEDVNSFSSEFEDFVIEGEKNIQKYYTIGSIPIFVIGLLSAILIFNSINLLYTEKSLESILGIILSRLPFTLATIAIATACYKICRYFIDEMTNIYKERLSMTKLSIVAKEVSNSVYNEEDDPDIKYALRAQLKMDLLKHYMKNEIGEDFSISTLEGQSNNVNQKYQPTNPPELVDAEKKDSQID